MRDPLQIEHSFRTLQAELPYPASQRMRFAEIAHFLHDLDISGFDAEPYLLEIWDRLVATTTGFDPTGFNPEEILNTATFLERVQSESSVFGSLPDVGKAVAVLKDSAAWVYAWCGETSKMLKVLGLESVDEELFESADDQDSISLPVQRLERLCDRLKAQAPTESGKIEAVLRVWKSLHPVLANSTYVAVVERPLLRGPGQQDLGGLRRFTVDLQRIQKGEDELRFEVAVVGAESESRALVHAPITAARRLLSRTGALKNGNHFVGKIEFGAEYAMHNGTSANVALAALFYCAALSLLGSRDQYALAPSVVLTGDIDEYGKVLPVDANAIEPKVKAAFFSPMQYLAVPKVQLHLFAHKVRELERTYPHRHLHLLGIEQLQDLFFDRRLTSYQRIGNLWKGARWAWQKRMTLVTVFMIITLLTIIGGLLYGPVDRNPVQAEFSGKMMIVKNARGQVLEVIEVGSTTVMLTQIPFKLAAFSDIDDDGTNEIIWGQSFEDGLEQPSYVHCKSIGSQKYHWSYPIQFSLDYPYKPGMEDRNFTPHAILADDLDGDGKHEIILLAAHSNFFPGVVFKLDATSGRILSQYVHSGVLDTAIAQDLDDDGIKEIIAGGITNAFKEPCLIVLDPRFLQGQGPATQEYRASGYEPGLERIYIRFPTTDVSEVVADSAGLRTLLWIRSLPASRKLYISIGDVRVISADVRPSDFTVFFDFELNVRDFGTSDNFDWTANRLFQRGLLKKIPDKAYWEQYGKKLLYWDGDRWRNGRHVNRRYLEAVGPSADSTGKNHSKQLTRQL